MVKRELLKENLSLFYSSTHLLGLEHDCCQHIHTMLYFFSLITINIKDKITPGLVDKMLLIKYWFMNESNLDTGISGP